MSENNRIRKQGSPSCCIYGRSKRDELWPQEPATDLGSRWFFYPCVASIIDRERTHQVKKYASLCSLTRSVRSAAGVRWILAAAPDCSTTSALRSLPMNSTGLQSTFQSLPTHRERRTEFKLNRTKFHHGGKENTINHPKTSATPVAA